MTIARAAVAIVCATALWIAVSVDEVATAWVPVAVTLSMDSSFTLASPHAPVRAFVVGRRGDLVRLVRAPVRLRHAVAGVPADARTTAVEVEVRPTELEMPAGVEARVREVEPRRLVLQLARR